jgi:hypothetical protein
MPKVARIEERENNGSGLRRRRWILKLSHPGEAENPIL